MANKRKNTKRSTASKNNKKLENLSYTDGLNQEASSPGFEERVEQVKNLENLLGVKSSNAYGTRDKEIFEQNMQEMTTGDLQSLAVRVGVFPSGTRASLKNKLLKQFLSDVRGGSGVTIIRETHRELDPNDPVQARIKKLMNKGL